jgi:hypothetical protein
VHEALNWQVTPHAQALLQATLSHEPPPLQLMSHRPVPQDALAQAPVPLQSASVVPVPPMTLLHESVPLQSSLQEPVVQVTTVHDARPLQPIWQSPAPQVMSWQLWRPVQLTVHEVLSPQSTPRRHELSSEHWTSQLQPAGQATWRAHSSGLTAQSIVHARLSRSHEVHSAGHTRASGGGGGIDASTIAIASGTPASEVSTQNPAMQVRPVLHSAGLWHAKSPLRWLTEQLPAAAAVIARTASQIATSFTGRLRRSASGRLRDRARSG